MKYILLILLISLSLIQSQIEGEKQNNLNPVTPPPPPPVPPQNTPIEQPIGSEDEIVPEEQPESPPKPPTPPHQTPQQTPPQESPKSTPTPPPPPPPEQTPPQETPQHTPTPPPKTPEESPMSTPQPPPSPPTTPEQTPIPVEPETTPDVVEPGTPTPQPPTPPVPTPTPPSPPSPPTPTPTPVEPTPSEPTPPEPTPPEPTPPEPTPPTPPEPTPPSTPTLNTQECHDNLGLLMDDQGNTLMSNDCTPFVSDDDDQRFRFTVSFEQPYQFNEECLTLEVVYEETILEQGTESLNQWQFDRNSQEIVWNISLNNFVDVYNCEWIADDEQFTWICEFKVNIYFMGMIQQCYNSKLQVTLDRTYQNELIVNIQKNNVEGDCCENALSINTVFRFCTTIECDEFLPSPLTVIRKEDFYVEHRILSPGFSNFFLTLSQISLGDFLPVIVEQHQDEGRIRLALRSNIAKPNLVLTIICQLQKSAGGRMLQQNQDVDIGGDYKLKGTGQMSIVPIDSLEAQELERQQQIIKQEQQISKQEKQQMLKWLILACSLLTICILGLSIGYYLKQRYNNKYERHVVKNTYEENKTEWQKQL